STRSATIQISHAEYCQLWVVGSSPPPLVHPSVRFHKVSCMMTRDREWRGAAFVSLSSVFGTFSCLGSICLLGEYSFVPRHFTGWTHRTMDQRHKSYLRPLRRRWGLTQDELAFLIGVKSRSVISRLEGAEREPSLRAVLICAIVFNATPIEVFPGLLNEMHV